MADVLAHIAQRDYVEACLRWRHALLCGANADQVIAASRAVLVTGIRLLRQHGTVDKGGLIGPSESLERLEAELAALEDLANARASTAAKRVEPGSTER